MSEPLVVFVHVRKTAGTTMRRIIQRQYRRRNTQMIRNYFVEPDRCVETARTIAADPPEGLRALHGHMLFWPDIGWREGTRFFTFLRDPVERTISHHGWLRQRSAKFVATLEEALAEGLIHDNLQTRVLAGSMPFVADEETLAQALANLDRFDVVGLTERFDESVVLLTRTLGWRPMAYAVENVTPGRQPREALSAETLAVVERYNALDLELYARARERFERDVAAQPADFAADVEALRLANRCISEAPPDAELDRLPIPRDLDLASGADELLVQARAALLLRDAELERLRSGDGPAPARPAAEAPEPAAPATRAAALDAAAERARKRIKKTARKLEALEQSGTADPAEAESLRRDLARAQARLEGFERRRAKLRAPEPTHFSG